MKKFLLFVLIPLMAIIGTSWGNQANAQMSTVVIGTGTASANMLPFNNFYKNSFNQMVYYQNEVGEAGYIGEIAFDNVSTATRTFQEITIWMALTSDSLMTTTSWVPQDSLKQVFHATDYAVPLGNGKLSIRLDSTFYYDGIHNLALVVSRKDNGYASNIKFCYTPTSALSCLYRRNDQNATYADYPGTNSGSTSYNRPNITLIKSTDGSFCFPISDLSVAGVTESSINVEWGEVTDGSCEMAILDTLMEGTDLSMADITIPTTNSYSFTGLNPNTVYLIGIRKSCSAGLNSDWTTVFARTTAVPLPLPFICDFETEDSRNYWALENGFVPNKWIIDTNAHYGEESYYGMYINDGDGREYTYNMTGSSTVFAKVLLQFDEPGDYNIKYDWKCMGESSYDFIRVALVPANMGDMLVAGELLPTGVNATSLPSGIIPADGGSKLNLENDWQHYLGVLDIENAGNYYLVYMWRNDRSGGNLPPAAIDNVSLEAATCAGIDSIVVSDPTLTSVTINAYSESGNTFKLYYKEWSADNYDTLVITTPYVLNDLQPGTYYKGILRSSCGEGNDSYTTTDFQFGTECSSITLPWDFGGETTFMQHTNGGSEHYPYCWNCINGSGTNDYWSDNTISSRVHSGNSTIYFSGSSSTSNIHDDWLITPSIPFTGSEEISFWVKTTSSTTTTNYHGRFALYVSNDEATSMTDTANFYQLNISGAGIENNYVDFVGDDWQQITVQLPNTLTGSHYLAFVIKDERSYSFCLDDIYLYTISSCPLPSDVKATMLTSTSATITWTSDASSFATYYGAPGFNTDTAAMQSVTENSITLYDLNPNTEYSFRVMATCNDGAESSLSYPYIFKTPCAPIPSDALPFFEDFEDNITGSSAELDDCWIKGTNNTTQYPYVTSLSGERCLYMYSNSSSYCYVALPAFEEDISNLILSCSIRRYTNQTYNSNVSLGIMGNPYDISTFVPYDTLCPENLGEWNNFQYSFTNYNPDHGKFIAFLLPQGVTGYAHLDNIQITAGGSCETPTDPIVISVDATSAIVSWSDSESNSWMVYYGAPGFSIDTVSAPIAVSDTHAVTITGLTPQTLYEFVVAADCGDGSFSAPSLPIQFTTACAPIDALPYIEDFEAYESGSSAEISPCWVKHVIGSSTQYPYPTSTAAINGSRGLYFDSYATASTNYYCYAALPMFNEELSNLQIKFNMKNKLGTSSSIDYFSKIVLGVMSNPEDLNTFDTMAIFDMSDYPDGTINTYEYAFNNYQGEGRYITLLAPMVQRTSNNVDNMVYIDDIDVRLIPTCHRPINMVASNITANTIDLTWEGNAASYELEYSLHEDMSDSTVVTSATNSFQLTNLTPYTYYYINVRGLCSETDQSEWMLEPFHARTIMDCGVGYENFIDTIGTGTTRSTSYVLNGSSSYAVGKTWLIFTDEELASLGLVGNSNIIHSISLQTETAGSPITFRVYMAETNLEEFSADRSDTLPMSQMTLVYDGTMQFAANRWNEIMLDTPFTYSDSTNLMIAFERNTDISTSTYFYYEPLSLYRTVYYYSYPSGSNYNYRQKGRGNMIFNICGDVPSCVRPLHITASNITASTVDLSWTGTASSYQIVYDLESFNPDEQTTATTQTVTGNNVTLQNLLPNSNYYIYIRSICGEEYSVWSIPVKIHTPCEPIELPYYENFDSYPASTAAPSGQIMDPCWVKGTNNTTNYPYIYTTNAASAPNSMNLYGNSSSYSYAALPMFNEPITNTVMTFKLHKTSNNYGTLHVGVMTDPYDITTFQHIATVQPEETYTWEDFEVSFANYTGNGRFIAFKVPDSIYSYAQLDDIEVFATPSCQAPINVTVSNISTTSATVAWTDRETNPTGGYEIEYGPVGFELGTGTRITTNTNPTILNNLTVGSCYELYVRAICSENDEGRWSFGVAFNTNCGPIALPLMYDFENAETGSSADLPHCFTRYNDASYTSYQTYPYITSSTTQAHSGLKYLYFYMGTSSSYPEHAAMIFPEIDTINYPMNNNQMIFWGKSGTNPSKVIVGVMSNPNILSTFTAIDTISLTGTYTEYTVSFENYNDHGDYPAIMAIRPNTTEYAYIDDIIIEEQPACPRVYDLTTISATATTATVDWADTIGSSQWIVDYHIAGNSTMQHISATSHPFTITGLTSGTQYFFNVRPICASGDTSAAVHNEASFWTTQVPATIPYSYDFEDVTEWNNWQTNSNCDINWYRGTDNVDQGSYAMYISNDDGLTCSSSWDRPVNAVAYRDIDFGTDTSSFTMIFKASVGGTIEHNYDGVSVLLVDPTEEVVSSNTNITSPWGHVNDVAITTVRRDTNWNTYMVHFEQIAGIHRVVFYWFNQNTGSNHPFINQPGAVDNITINEQTCIRPYNLYASNIEATSATLNWGGNAASYEVTYRVAGSDPSTTITQIVNTNTLNISNLESSTKYVFWVRACCSATDTSYWSDSQYFKTICSRYIASDTIREDFSNLATENYNSSDGILPDCWEGYSNGSNGVLPHVVGGGSYWYAHDNNSLIMTSGSTNYGDTAIVRLPYTLEPVNALTMSYWMCTESDSYGVLEVGYLTSPDIANSFVTIKTIPASAATHHGGSTGNQSANVGFYDTVQFENVPDEAEAIAFRWVKSSTFYSVCLDDIVVYANITCPAPVLTNTTVDFESATLTWNGSAANYQLLYKEATDANWSDTITTTETSYTITGLLPETNYMVMLRALCGEENGNSIWTEAEFTTDDLPCFIPTNLTTTNIDYEKVSLDWESEGTATRWIVNVFNGTTNIIDTVDSKPATIENLYSAMEYQAAVKSLCSDIISSDWSDTITFTTKNCPTVTNIAVNNITTNSAVITWDSPDALKWEINYGMEGFGQGEGEFVEVNERTYTITNLDENTSYDVYVRIYCTENTYGQWGEKVTFTTEENIPEGIDGINGNYQFTIYPNPTSGATTISLNGVEGEITINIIDMNGRIINSDTIECGSDCEKRMDVEGLAQGTYFVRILGDNINSVRKLIVR